MRYFLFYCCIEDPYEMQGMFDVDGNCLGWWSADDANWRNEYFSGFMAKLGIEVSYNQKFEKNLKKIARSL